MGIYRGIWGLGCRLQEPEDPEAGLRVTHGGQLPKCSGPS